MKHVLLMIGLAFGPTTGVAQAVTCPDAPDHSAGIEALITQIQGVDSAADAKLVSDQMWALWTDAPNEQAQAMLDRGMTRRRSFDYLGALEDLNALVAFCPQYAEGYNQRAFVNYLRQDFAAALVDLDRALALSPKHIAAMSGRALTLVGLGRTDEARVALADALALNPWLPERGLAGPGGPLAPQGKDI
jgi:tetratricopeptide (TPR) repeat protein